MRSTFIHTLSTFLFTGLFALSVHAGITAYYVPDQVLLKVQPSIRLATAGNAATANNPALQAALTQIGAMGVTEMFPQDQGGTVLSRMYRVTLTPGSDVLQAIGTLQKLAAVESAQPNYLAHVYASPSDADFVNGNQWGLTKIQCPAAWDIFTGSDKVVVAVVDTGVDWSHPDLAANIWMNQFETANNPIDADHNGYVDDIRGWDFLSAYYGTAPDNASRIVLLPHTEDNNPGNDPNDPIMEHGTHVAGIVGAVANNTVSGAQNTVGVLWNCKIMALRAGDINGIFNEYDIVQALRYAADNGARVVNMSYGGYWADGWEYNALQYAHSKGVVLCAAAGNDAWDEKSYPASYDNVISVAATDKNDALASFSNFGSRIDICAPGTEILSTVLSDNGSYASFDGTSMATPFVSGVAGLILGYGETLGKKLTPDQVRYILKQTADNIDAINPNFVGQIGAGRVNAAAALALVQSMPSMVTRIEIDVQNLDNASLAANTVQELKSLTCKAWAIYTDNEAPTDITNQVTWSLRPVKYGHFSSITPGKFLALQVPGDREVELIATLNDHGYAITGTTMVTILNDPSASPLALAGPDAVGPLTVTQYQATFINANGDSVDVTAQSTWDVTDGTQYASFDEARPGTLMTTGSSGGQSVIIRVTYVDPTDHRKYQESQTVQVDSLLGPKQVSGLLLTAPDQLAAGSTTQLQALLFFADGTEQDMTGENGTVWTSSPAAAGSFITPGLFFAAGVQTTTSVTLSVQCIYNGQVYSAQVTTSVIPAVPQAAVTTASTPTTGSGINSILPAGTPCALPSLMVLLGVFACGSLLLGRQQWSSRN